MGNKIILARGKGRVIYYDKERAKIREEPMIKKDWKTTLFGALAGIGMVLHNSGIAIGHFGGTDFTTVLTAVSTLLLGLHAVDRKQQPPVQDK
jgi:hypothetical protein